MNKARETILRLVAEGKISVEEADELLDAMEGASKGPTFKDFFGNRRVRERARRPNVSTWEEDRRQYGNDEAFKFNFPWDQPDWQWPWEKQDWQWPWDKKGWPWEKAGGEKSVSMFEVPEDAQLKIKSGGGDLIIRGTEEASLRVTAPRANSKVTMEGKIINVKSAGDDLVMEVPAKIVSMEMSQAGGDLRIEDLKADLVAKTIGGDISIYRFAGRIQMSSEGGDVSLEDIIGSTEVGIQANAGDISLKILSTVEEGSVSLIADNGDISLILPSDSQCQVSANAPAGDIDHSFTLQPEIIDKSDHYLNVKLNGGGADFVLLAKSGDITIQA